MKEIKIKDLEIGQKYRYGSCVYILTDKHEAVNLETGKTVPRKFKSRMAECKVYAYDKDETIELETY